MLFESCMRFRSLLITVPYPTIIVPYCAARAGTVIVYGFVRNLRSAENLSSSK